MLMDVNAGVNAGVNAICDAGVNEDVITGVSGGSERRRRLARKTVEDAPVHWRVASR